MYANEPTWSETVRQRRDAWESKARITDERVQLPPSYKVIISLLLLLLVIS